VRRQNSRYHIREENGCNKKTYRGGGRGKKEIEKEYKAHKELSKE
jgi:hypothetical protein